MDLDELKQQWSVLNEKLDASLRLNAAVLRETGVRASTRRVFGAGVVGLLLDLLMLLWLGSFVAGHVGQLRFFLPGLGAGLFWLYLVVTRIRHLALLSELDLGAPVIESQRRLQQIRVERIRMTKVVFLSAVLLWVLLMIVALESFLGLDVWRLFGWRYVVANLLVGVAMIPLLAWVARRLGDCFRGRPLLRRLLDDIAGRNLSAALAQLDSLARFERSEV